MTSQQAILSPLTILEQLKKNGVTHVVYLPDSETNHLFLAMEDDPDIVGDLHIGLISGVPDGVVGQLNAQRPCLPL